MIFPVSRRCMRASFKHALYLDARDITSLQGEFEGEYTQACRGVIPLGLCPNAVSAPVGIVAEAMQSSDSRAVLLDVRNEVLTTQPLTAYYSRKNVRGFELTSCHSQTQFGICSLTGALNIPLVQLKGRLPGLAEHVRSATAKRKRDDSSSDAAETSADPVDLFVVCRRGIDSLVRNTCNCFLH
jgi:hypothetical protein